MLHEKINLGNSGYGTRDTILTTYVQNNLEGNTNHQKKERAEVFE